MHLCEMRLVRPSASCATPSSTIEPEACNSTFQCNAGAVLVAAIFQLSCSGYVCCMESAADDSVPAADASDESSLSSAGLAERAAWAAEDDARSQSASSSSSVWGAVRQAEAAARLDAVQMLSLGEVNAIVNAWRVATAEANAHNAAEAIRASETAWQRPAPGHVVQLLRLSGGGGNEEDDADDGDLLDPSVQEPLPAARPKKKARIAGSTVERGEVMAIPDVPACSASDSAAVLEAALMRSAAMITRSSPAMPWEKGLLRSVFCSELPSLWKASSFMPPPIPRPDAVDNDVPDSKVDRSEHAGRPVVGRLSVRKKPCIKSRAVCARVPTSAPNIADPIRRRVVERWCSVVACAPEEFFEGRVLLDGGDQFLDGMAAHLACVFVRKATSTLTKRVMSICDYVTWFRTYKPDAFPIPFVENDVHAYFTSNSVARSNSKRSSFLEAVNFCAFTLGLDDTACISRSGRLRGLADSALLQRGPTKQAPVILVAHVLILEDILFSPLSDMRDRVLVGGFLALLYSRSRFTDAQKACAFVTDFLGDQGFIEIRSSEVKTATSVQKRREQLPMVAPAFGLRNYNWALKWLEVRESSGLSLSSGYPLLPAVRLEGWGREAMTSDEASNWLHEVLFQHGVSAEMLPAYTSHSFKSTPLSWCAKFGIDSDHRRFLGHHSKPGDSSLLIYGRDNMSAPLRSLVQVIQAVRSGLFLPDCTRSGMMVTDCDAQPISPCCVPPNSPDGFDADAVSLVDGGSVVSHCENIPDTADVSSSASASDVSSEEDAKLEPFAPASSVDADQFNDEGKQFVLHALLGTLHVRRIEDGSRFVCGRVMHARHVVFEDSTQHSQFYNCRQCFHDL
jgi:hypothetical protein